MLNLKSKYFLAVSVILAVFISCNIKKNTSSEKGKADTIQVAKDFVFGDKRDFAQCHASTLVRLPDGQFLVAWFGGTEEKNPDVGIWVSKGKPGKWSAPVEIAKIREDAHWNPVLQRAANGKIYLYFKVGKVIPYWETWVKTSDDNGKTWSEAYELVKGDKGGRGPVKNKLIELADGTWLAGASNEINRWEVFVDRSEDKGKTWKASPYFKIDTTQIKGKGAIQPTLWESKPGTVHMLIRTTGGMIGRSDSYDNGKTWSVITKTSLANPNSGIDLAKLADGTLVLVYNPDAKNWGSRTPLTIAISQDNGKTWPDQFDLDKGKKGDEFSYPAIVSWGDSVAVSYTWNRQKIAFWKGNKADMLKLARAKK
ncbi:sialidase family protein [Dyadobacter psychrotolerans]|uniref:Neuraminidase (Sialidase) n=1 Tax=Dyadobacter psychrotolerans TaxID=2541721 RepID=A0A4R5DQJ6_9BACT|nr:sialidase family protein [Dyadobacter psychrotolerans]TDE16656.1 neuraminidase (sialidase) [Dyadobacter psychrotolerans]